MRPNSLQNTSAILAAWNRSGVLLKADWPSSTLLLLLLFIYIWKNVSLDLIIEKKLYHMLLKMLRGKSLVSSIPNIKCRKDPYPRIEASSTVDDFAQSVISRRHRAESSRSRWNLLLKFIELPSQIKGADFCRILVTKQETTEFFAFPDAEPLF